MKPQQPKANYSDKSIQQALAALKAHAPESVAVNPVANKIYVANTGSNNVTVIDGATNSTTTVSVGAYPLSVAVNPTPIDILRSATVRAGEYAGQPCGEIKTGQRPDLLLLDGNPMEDLNNLRLIAGVMVKGRWLPATELQRRLEAIRDQPCNYRQRGPAR